MPIQPSNPRVLMQQLDSGRISHEEFRQAMSEHAREIIVEMEEDRANPAVAFLEQMLSRRAASRLLKKNEESVIREVLAALAEVEDFPPGRWLWNAAHPHIPLHAFFRTRREPVFRITQMEAMPQVVSVTLEHGPADKSLVAREEFRMRRDRRGRLGVEHRRRLA
ncbi:MAG TPA: hypothetical protein PK490_17690 [Prosthecobacter sp.]|nr:hypothetical protein [Prosthecobacter sp.]HRK16122.1 hypothetical protein [Prosthecobacter sp.]